MYINKLIKKQVMLILATFVLVGTLAVTASFALFEETKSNATDQKMVIGDLNITFTGGSAISITDINPMTDTVAGNQTNNIYTWTITNSGTVPYQFKVKVVNDSNYTTNLLPHQFIRYSLDGGTASSLGSGQTDYEIASGVIDAGATNTYKLRLWVADASTYKLPNSALGQEIHLKISVEGKAGDGWLPSNLKDRILASNDVETPLTTPGSEVSSATEALLASTEDDYGTSYYFRGNVQNNYVQFANMCWRIVRILGDGSIKLVLHNNNTSNVTNPCSSANNSDYAAYSGSSSFNSKYDDPAYIGFMYGTPGSGDYASTHANINKSTILTYLETWYKDNLILYTDKIADTIWCNDKSTTSGLGYGTNSSYYAGFNRISNTNPSLVCPNDNDGGKLSKYTVDDKINGNGLLDYKIGLLTADEAAFAGFVFNVPNGNEIYLRENAADGYFTMTPSNFEDGEPADGKGYTIIWITNYIQTRLYSMSGVYSNRVRPAISLKSTVTVTGTGTSEDPYVVQ
ncbi:MAG: hypothetical protein Q4C33_03175 [bacterium]|nr:hypothetical protein [bacterium]